ncbi:MAG: hypothetical protein R3275_08815 [Saprospiraceae bacterium]|nr:hypothetical protein [Saprospiraceae bacterium]
MHKCIFQGRLDFGSASSFDIAYRQFEQRAEVFFKNEVVFKVEDVFDENSNSLDIPRTVSNITEKVWKNTNELFDYIRQFALSGQIEAWMVESGKILEYELFEPHGDKSVITAYQSGRDLLKNEGKEEEAYDLLTKAISKYDKHSQAYERRGYTNIMLERPEDARYDFDKSIRLDNRNAMAYYGRGWLNMKEEKWEEAVEDFSKALKNLLAVQSIFWKVRRMKVECLIQLERWEEALKECKLLIRRKFASDDPNFKYTTHVNTMYVKCLIQTGEEQKALDFIEESLDSIPKQQEDQRRAMLTDRGLVKQKLGEKSYIKDWEEAAALGEPRANELLATESN